MSDEIRLTAPGDPVEVESLWEWLGREPELRGHLAQVDVRERPGTMGSTAELVVTLASSGTAAVLARSLGVWLRQRRSDVKVKVKGPKGHSIDLSVTDVRDAQALIQSVLSSPMGDGKPR